MSIQIPPGTANPEKSSSHNLWETALDTLGDEVRNSFDLTKASRGNVLSRALKEAQEKKHVCAQKCWTLKKRNGETVILRDVVEKIIVWVEKFIAVGDAATQYDPGHAAPAWAALRFVLQMAVNDRRVLGEMVENLEAVSHLITRYAILEELYLQRDSAARDKLEDLVVLLYAEILIFLAKARKFFQRPAKIRLAMSVIQFSADEQMAKINVLDSQISRLTEIFSVETQINTAKEVTAMNNLLSSLNKPVQRLVDRSSISTQVLEDGQLLSLLHWLSPVPFTSHHKWLSQSRIPGSGQWLLDHARYVNWRNTSKSSIFLLHGILGSGKTSLASAVVDSLLQESSGQASPAPIAYFYCTKNSAEPERRDPDDIMRSIVRQLSTSHGCPSKFDERVLREYERRQEVAKIDGFETTRLQAAECVRLILDTTAVNPATIVLDAVDEINSNSRHILFSALNQIVQDSLNVVKIFVTSRDDAQIHAFLSNTVAIRIRNEHNRKDIDNFVHREVCSAIRNRRILNGVVSDNLKQDLMDTLIAGAGEMFIWVVRQIENLSRMKTEADIKSAMRALPQNTLNDLYEEDFTQLLSSGQHTRGHAMHVFSILLCTQEALSPEALVQATVKTASLQGETMTLAKMIDICLNLVALDPELNIMRFAHISFQEFLETKAEFAPQSIHRVAATSCLDFCLEGSPTGMEIDLSPKDNFHRYSAIYWAEHCRIATDNGFNDLLTNKMREFVFDEGEIALTFVDWNQEVSQFVKTLPNDHVLVKELRSVIDSGGSPLFTACVFGLTSIVKDLAQMKEYDWNRTNDLGQSGLYLAAATGRKTIIQGLLRLEVNVNISGGKFDHPLHAACAYGHSSVVKLLLDHGANPKIGSKSALEYSLLAGHESVASLLLTSKFGISSQAEYDSILQQSAEAGFTDVVRFLCKEYASLYGERGSSRCRAVEVAIFKGRIGVVERYIQRSSDPKIDIPADAIATAALGGQNSMISLLVDQGLDLDAEGVFGTPLRAACLMCHESTVRLLLKFGASLHISGPFGEPLQAAAMRGHVSIIRTLLSNGANMNGTGGLYGTALQAAAHRGHQKVVEILLDAGADVHQDGFSRDAFHAASEGGHEEVVRLLLDKGFKIQHDLPGPQFSTTWPSPYKNLLRDASPNRYNGTKPAQDHQPKSKDWRQRASTTDSSHVVERMRGFVVSELETVLPYRERPEYRRLGGPNYALPAAAAKGHVNVVKLLFGQLNKMDIPKSEIVAAFNQACENGHEEVASIMISDQIEVQDLQNALGAAALNGHMTVVNFLIDHEDRLGLARIETVSISRPAAKSSNRDITSAPNQWANSLQETFECDSTTRAILKSGVKGGKLSIVKRGQDLVVERCTSVASRHLYGEALSIAAANRNIHVMEALLDGSSDFDLVELTKTLNSICAWGSVEALKLLLGNDKKKILGNSQYSCGLSQAARNDSRQVLLYWLEEHLDRQHLVVDPKAVIDVAGNNFMNILPLLIKQIRLTDTFGETVNQCLQVASRSGHHEVVEYLIGEGADLNLAVEEVRYTSEVHDRFGHHRQKLTSLQAALIGFERFGPISRNEDILDNLQPSWTEADASSQQRTLDTILAKGADPNGAVEYQRYPLNIAAAYGTIEIVQALISAGAQDECATGEYGTALEAAARREIGGLPIIKALLEASIPASPTNASKTAALNEALSYFLYFESLALNLHDHEGKFLVSNSLTDVLKVGPGAAVRTLLAHLPQEKADDSRYGLLAQMACVAGDQDCIKLLLQHGMDVDTAGYYYGTALQAACRVGNIAITQYLLSSGANVNILQGAHATALRAATLGGHEELVRILIASGADVNLCYKDRDKSVLHLALASKNQAVFKTLLFSNADVNTQSKNQDHILIGTCKHGDATLVELLLSNDVDVNILGTEHSPHYSDVNILGTEHSPFYSGWLEEATPLHAACTAGHIAVVQILLNHKADIEKTNESSPTPLFAAIRNNHLSVVRQLLCAGANVNYAVQGSPLFEAAEDCKLEILELLLSAGAIIGGPSTKANALAKASYSSQHLAIERLLEALSGTRYEAEICDEALSAAVKGGNDEVVCLLLERGASPTFEILRQACAAGMLEAVRMLVDAGIDVNQDNGDDALLLHVAASHSRPRIVRFLIDQGANSKLYSTKYGSPLVAAMEGSMAPFLRARSQAQACQSLAKQLPLPEPLNKHFYRVGGKTSQQKPGHKEFSDGEQVVRNLLDTDAEIDASIRKFGNALHLASYMGSSSIVRQLLGRMKNINIFGGYFGSPLIAALKGDHRDIVELLLDQDINVNWYSLEHGCALHYACRYRSKKLIQILLDHGADVNTIHDKCGSALAAAANPNEGRAIPSGDTRSSEEKRAVVELLLRHEPKVQIMECDLSAAASWRYSSDGEHFMRLFLKHDQSVIANEEVIVKTIQKACRYGPVKEDLAILLKRDGGLGTTSAMLEAAYDVEVIKMLLKQKPICQVTAKVLESAARRYYEDSVEIIDLLLTHDPKAPITEATIIAAMKSQCSNPGKLKLLLDRNPELEITDRLLKESCSAHDTELLLQRRTKEQTISSEVLETVAQSYNEAAPFVSLLLKHDKSIKITPAVLHAAITSSINAQLFLRTLFEHDPTLSISQGDVIVMAKSLEPDEAKEELQIFLEYGKTVEFTAELRQVLNERFPMQSDTEIKYLFYRLERK